MMEEGLARLVVRYQAITLAQVYRYFSITIPLVKSSLSLITSDWIPGDVFCCIYIFMSAIKLP